MRPIDGDALIEEYDRVHVGPPGGARKLMEDAPTIEPEPKTAYWVDGGQYAEGHPHHEWHCSECGWSTMEAGLPGFNYCPMCGLRMEVKS